MKKALIIGSTCLALLLALLFGTDPNRIPSFMLVLPFLLLFICLLVAATLLLEKWGLGRRKSLQIAALCSSIPLLLIVLQSIGQLTVRDVLVLSVLFAVSYFYLSRSTASS